MSFKYYSPSNRIFGKVKYKILSQIEDSQKKSDKNRSEKLKKLQKITKTPDFEKVTIHNMSNKTLPKYVLESLQLGLSHSIGGKPRKLQLMSNFDAFFEFWKKYASDQNVNRFKIFEIQAELRVFYSKLIKCNTKNDKIEKTIKFLTKIVI